MEARNGPRLMTAGARAVVQPRAEILRGFDEAELPAGLPEALEGDPDGVVGDDFLVAFLPFLLSGVGCQNGWFLAR